MIASSWNYADKVFNASKETLHNFIFVFKMQDFENFDIIFSQSHYCIINYEVMVITYIVVYVATTFLASIQYGKVLPPTYLEAKD